MNPARVGIPENRSGHLIMDSSLGLVPETIRPLIDLLNAIWSSDRVRPALLEMARLKNARTVNCVMCKNVRYDIARQDGLTETKVSQIDQYETSTLSEEEKLVLEYTHIYLNQPGHMTDAFRARLKAHLRSDQLVHLSLAIATFNAFSKCAVVIGGMPDSMPVTEFSASSLRPL